MKIIFVGKGERSLPCLRELLESDHEVISVIVSPHDVASEASPSLAQLGRENNLEVFTPEDINNSESETYIRHKQPDIVVLVGFTQIIKKHIFSIPPHGFLNVHGGKLPEYKGSSTLNWMIINGEEEGGISLIRIDEGIDTGPVLEQRRFPIASNDTIEDLVEKTKDLSPQMIRKAVDDIENGIQQEDQYEVSEGCYYHHRIPEDGRIIWRDMTDIDVYNLIRALPEKYPAFCYVGDTKINCLSAKILDQEFRGVPGRVVRKADSGVVVIAQNRGVLLKKLYFEDESKASVNPVLSVGDSLI